MFEASFLPQVALRGLGQAQMRAGQGFMGPFGMYSDIGPIRGYQAPPGFPSATEQVLRSYVCPDGSHQTMTPDEARAQGCRPVGMGAAAPSGGGNPTVSVSPMTVGTPPADQNEFFPPFIFPGYGYPNAAPKRLTCKRNVNPDTGEETFDCEEVPPPATFPVVRYPTLFLTPFL